MAKKDEEMIVTPWKVTGKIDYDRLIQEFGTQPLTDELIGRMIYYVDRSTFYENLFAFWDLTFDTFFIQS